MKKSKKFGSQKMCFPKFCAPKKYWSRKNFGLKKNFGPKKFRVPKNYVWVKLLSQTIFVQKNVRPKKYLEHEKLWVPKIFKPEK